MHSWSKKLSTTDAQQQTTGGIVPYLRLTSGNLPRGSFQTWFRNVFFGNCSWSPSYFNNKPVQEAKVIFTVSIKGSSKGNIAFIVTHDDTRQDNHNAPNTWLHWPNQMATYLQATNLAGHRITLSRDNANAFNLDIR